MAKFGSSHKRMFFGKGFFLPILHETEQGRHAILNMDGDGVVGEEWAPPKLVFEILSKFRMGLILPFNRILRSIVDGYGALYAGGQ